MDAVPVEFPAVEILSACCHARTQGSNVVDRSNRRWERVRTGGIGDIYIPTQKTQDKTSKMLPEDFELRLRSSKSEMNRTNHTKFTYAWP